MLGAVMSSAHALPPQAVAPVKLPHGGRGVDGPFFPATRAAPVLPSTGAALQQQAQQRVDARLGGNTVLSNGAAVTKAQAQSSGLGFRVEALRRDRCEAHRPRDDERCPAVHPAAAGAGAAGTAGRV
ncbi:Hypothetical protein BCPG_04046, partial [Burkholderia cenocepacia PC184]